MVKPRYCRLLGHDVDFSYCQKPGSKLFCRHMIGCWSGRMDIRRFIAENYSPEDIRKALDPLKPKIASLVELIQRSGAATEGSANAANASNAENPGE